MNEKERDAYAREKEQQMHEDDARLGMAEAYAREAQATEQLKELTGLKALRTKLGDHLSRLKNTDPTDVDQSEAIKADFERSRSEFAIRVDAIKLKLDAIDQVREEKLNAQLDQLDEEIVALDARMKKEGFQLAQEDAKELDQVHGQLEAAKVERDRVAEAREESRREMKSSFGKAIDDLKRTWQHARDRVESARHGAG